MRRLVNTLRACECRRRRRDGASGRAHRRETKVFRRLKTRRQQSADGLIVIELVYGGLVAGFFVGYPCLTEVDIFKKRRKSGDLFQTQNFVFVHAQMF